MFFEQLALCKLSWASTQHCLCELPWHELLWYCPNKWISSIVAVSHLLIDVQYCGFHQRLGQLVNAEWWFGNHTIPPLAENFCPCSNFDLSPTWFLTPYLWEVEEYFHSHFLPKQWERYKITFCHDAILEFRSWPSLKMISWTSSYIFRSSW